MQQAPVKDRLSPAELSAWRGFLRAHAALVGELDAELQAEQGLPLTSYEVLLRLEDATGRRLRMSELADSLFLSQSGATRLVDRMAREGLLTRERCDTDGRGTYAVLTDAGLERLRLARPVHLAGVRRLFLDLLAPEERDELGALWDRLAPGGSR
jgi:DNA-binding MarR family transcriptional regulator